MAEFKNSHLQRGYLTFGKPEYDTSKVLLSVGLIELNGHKCTSS